jgi:hypothetical protein
MNRKLFKLNAKYEVTVCYLPHLESILAEITNFYKKLTPTELFFISFVISFKTMTKISSFNKNIFLAP